MFCSCEEPAKNNIQWGVFHCKIRVSKIYEFIKKVLNLGLFS